MKTVSAWLSEIGSHSILANQMAKDSFKEETGHEAPWGDGYTQKEMQRQIDGRGKGGSIDEGAAERLIGALDVAAACYQKFAGEEMAAPKFGMGSQFREYVAAIKRAGN